MKTLLSLLLLFALSRQAAAQDSPADPARELEMRQRYESVLLRNPFQERAFNSVYEGYAKVEGVDKWIDALTPRSKEGADQLAALLVLGQVYDRQFKTAEAIAAFEQAAARGEARPQFKVLLGTLYYKAGKDEQAARLLGEALDALTDLDQRASVSRLLGNLYLRQGKRDQAVAVWKRIAEQNPGEIFAQLELAEIYEDNRMWDQAIEVYRGVAENSKDDPYRRCRALRSIGQCFVQAEKFKDAIATYEQALELVAPGNWLFEDIKLRLVGVYEDIGDLAGLVKYVEARLQQTPGDAEFRDLLAETHTRMAKFDEAAQQYRLMLERNPRNSAIYEKLIALHQRTDRKSEVVAAFEKLIELFPTDSDYLRRLGEFHLRENQPDQAKETWRRLVKEGAGPEKTALLANWLESYEFTDEAIAAYQQALEKKKDKDWTGRLAALKFQKGQEAEAVQLWLSLAGEDSKPEELAEVASILESNNRHTEALGLRKRAVEKAPENLEARLAYARTLMKKQQFEPAVAEFELLAAQDKNEFLMQQGEQGRIDAWRELGVLEEKQKQLENEVTANSADSRKLGQLARLYERAGQREKAVALYEGRREKEPDNLEHLRALAGLYRAAKQTEQAIAAFRVLLEKDKLRARVYQKELLDIYLAVDLKDDAILAAEALVSLAPGDPEVHLTLAQVYQTYRQPEKALGEYRAALRLEPNEPDYHRQFGEALEQEKHYGDAQEAFRKMLDTAKEDSTRLTAVSALARIHLQQDRLAELTGEFQRRIRNTPKKLAAYEELAVIFKESGQIARGVEVLEGGLNTVEDKAAALKGLIRAAFEAQDFPKVKSYFEQLVAMSGKPTANEFERLGQIYAQLGEIEKARQTWNRIVAESPKDPKAHDRLAQILREAGFAEESLALKARAVELEPTDFKRRFDYAQLLAQNEQPVEAMKQLSQILDLGDAAEAKEEKQPEKKVKPVQRGPQGGGAVNAYQFAYGMGRFSGGYHGGNWQGSFQQFRPQLLMFMANVAQQSIGEDAFIEQFQERAKKAKGSTDARRDLLTVLQMYNRVEDALKVSLELLEIAPNDVDLLQQTALYYQSQQQLDKAIPLLERLAASQPKHRLQALQGLVPLYFQNKQEDKALELADQLLKENPSDMTTLWAMGNFMQMHGKFDRARAIYTRAIEVDPQMKPHLLATLGQIALQDGKTEEARKTFMEMLTADLGGPRYAWMGPRRQVNLYIPQGPAGPGGMMGQVRFFGGPMGQMPGNVFGNIDWSKQNAIQQLKMLSKRGAEGATTNDFTVDLEKTALSYKSAVSATDRNKAWDSAKLLCAYYTGEKQIDKALALLKALREAGYEEIEWFNIAIFLAEQKEEFDRMAAFYDEVQQRFPAKSREVARAKAMTFAKAKKYDEAARIVRDMNQQRVPPGEILAMIRALRAAGEKKSARALLEEHLAGVSRNPDALQELAQLYGEENEFDKAIALAGEAWERKAHGRTSQAYFYGPRHYYGGPGGNPDNLLADLHRYHVAQGTSEELINQFKQRLDKQPGSVQAHENLAELHRMNDNRQAALDLYQQLAAKRPHLHQVRRQIAQLFTEMGDSKRATQYYEELIKANPAAYEQFQWELRWLYQRMGKGKELAQMEEKVVEKARDPYQIQQVAQRLKQEGDFEKAAELYRKAIKMSPGDPWMKNQLAQVFVDMGKLDEAVTLYLEWIDSPQMRGQPWVDHTAMRDMVGLFRAAGRLQELKDRCEGELKRNPNDRTALGLKTHIALIEKRFAEATAGFKSLADGGRDPNGMWQVMELAEITGDSGPVFELMEKADPNNLDHNRLARFYLARGEHQKTEEMILKYVERQMGFGNGGWILREGLSQLCEFEMWEAAEKFIRKHRETPLQQQWEQQQFDAVIAEQYIRNNRFGEIIEEVLKKESFKGRDLELLKAILQQYQWQNQSSRRLEFLEKICAADPKNRELNFQLADLYDLQKDGQKKLAILERLAAEEPASAQYQEARARCLIGLGRAGEALAGMKKWADEKPIESRWSALSRVQAAMGRRTEARASLVKAGEVADASRKDDLKLQLAQFDAEQGGIEAPKQVRREMFEQKKDQGSFHGYLSFLQSHGFDREAHEFFLANKDGGYLEQYSGDDALTLCLGASDYQSPLDLNWRFTRYGERWNRDRFFTSVAKLFSDRGKFPLLLADLQARIAAETNRNQLLQQKLAQAWMRAGQPEKALALHDEMILARPFDRAALAAKAQLLSGMGREDEALALLRDLKGVKTLLDEIEARFQLIETLARLNREAEAWKELDALLAWARGGPALERAANIYRGMKKWDKAAELYEQSGKTARGWNHNMLLFHLGQCYAKLGRHEDSLKAWGSMASSPYRGSGFDDRVLMNWLISEGLNDLALRVAQTRLEKHPENVDNYAKLASALLAQGKTNEVFAAFERGAQALKPAQQTELRDQLGHFILEHDLLAAALARHSQGPSAPLARALINLSGRPDEKSARAKLLAGHLDKFSAEDAESQLMLGWAFLKTKRHAEAAVQFRKVLGSTNEFLRRQAAQPLAESGFATEALPVLAEWLRTQPQAFVNDSSLIAAVAKTGDSALISKLNEVLVSSALHESQKEYFTTLIAHHRGQTNEARARLPRLVSAVPLNSEQLQKVAGLCEDQGLFAERVACLKRLAAPGHPNPTRESALGELIKAHVKAGDFAQAVESLAGLRAWWGLESCANARETLASAATKENFATLKEALLAASRAHAEQDISSDLIGLCAQVGQRVGQSESAARLAGQAGLNEPERAEAAAWDDLVEQWEVAGPFPNPPAEPPVQMQFNQYGEPIVHTPSRSEEPALSPSLLWKKTDPKHELGTIRLGPVLGVTVAESQGQFAYARTTITSPEDRTVTLALGSDDSVSVWVNGQQEHVSSEGRSLHPDQDRFTVRLKKGENRVLLKVGNFTDAWGFCVRILAGREGLVLAQSSAP